MEKKGGSVQRENYNVSRTQKRMDLTLDHIKLERNTVPSPASVSYLFIYLFLVNGPKSDTGGNCLTISYKCFSVF